MCQQFQLSQVIDPSGRATLERLTVSRVRLATASIEPHIIVSRGGRRQLLAGPTTAAFRAQLLVSWQ